MENSKHEGQAANSRAWIVWVAHLFRLIAKERAMIIVLRACFASRLPVFVSRNCFPSTKNDLIYWFHHNKSIRWQRKKQGFRPNWYPPLNYPPAPVSSPVFEHHCGFFHVAQFQEFDQRKCYETRGQFNKTFLSVTIVFRLWNNGYTYKVQL